jgi:hypothetical protein
MVTRRQRLNNTVDLESALFEHRFWLQVLGDHSRFIFFSLAPTETEYILLAQEFILLLDKLLEEAVHTKSENELVELNQKAYEATLRLREFKLELLSMSLASNLKIQLPPSFINDMVNELEEYIYILNNIRNNDTVFVHPIHYHMLWLSDAVGHAASIEAELDFVEADLIDQASRYKQQFQDLYLKALIMNGYLRTEIETFQALIRLNEQAATAILSFTEYLDSLRDKRTDHKVLGTLMPLMADHMSRESCYYLWKLSYSTPTIRRPDCDPTRPRQEG